MTNHWKGVLNRKYWRLEKIYATTQAEMEPVRVSQFLQAAISIRYILKTFSKRLNFPPIICPFKLLYKKLVVGGGVIICSTLTIKKILYVVWRRFNIDSNMKYIEMYRTLNKELLTYFEINLSGFCWGWNLRHR